MIGVFSSEKKKRKKILLIESKNPDKFCSGASPKKNHFQLLSPENKKKLLIGYGAYTHQPAKQNKKIPYSISVAVWHLDMFQYSIFWSLLIVDNENKTNKKNRIKNV